MQDLVQSVITKKYVGSLGVSRVRRCLNVHVARVSADLTESGRLFHACILDGRKESAYIRVFA